jgi:predicted transcriptional regulator
MIVLQNITTLPNLASFNELALKLVWRHRVQGADQVRERLDHPGRRLKRSTIRTELRRLEEKGYLAHSIGNRTFLYRPAETRQAVAGRAVQRVVDWFCEGLVEALLMGMVDRSPRSLRTSAPC